MICYKNVVDVTLKKKKNPISFEFEITTKDWKKLCVAQEHLLMGPTPHVMEQCSQII